MVYRYIILFTSFSNQFELRILNFLTNRIVKLFLISQKIRENSDSQFRNWLLDLMSILLCKKFWSPSSRFDLTLPAISGKSFFLPPTHCGFDSSRTFFNLPIWSIRGHSTMDKCLYSRGWGWGDIVYVLFCKRGH